MVAISGVMILAGYQLVSYGWSQVRGNNAGFFDILWPGRYTGNTPDGGSSSSSSSTTSTTRTNPNGVTVPVIAQNPTPSFGF